MNALERLAIAVEKIAQAQQALLVLALAESARVKEHDLRELKVQEAQLQAAVTAQAAINAIREDVVKQWDEMNRHAKEYRRQMQQHLSECETWHKCIVAPTSQQTH